MPAGETNISNARRSLLFYIFGESSKTRTTALRTGIVISRVSEIQNIIYTNDYNILFRIATTSEIRLFVK